MTYRKTSMVMLAALIAVYSDAQDPIWKDLLKADERFVGSKPLILHEVGDLELIWNDAGTGADVDCSIWRAKSDLAKGYYSLGDIVVATHSKPAKGFLVRPIDPPADDSFREPVDYEWIWNDKRSGGDKDVTLWKVKCPAGFVSLGNVATSGSRPKTGDVFCVKSSYTSYGKWSSRPVWTDAGSGAYYKVQIYEAEATSSNQRSVKGFGAVQKNLPDTPFLLKKEFHTYWTEKPIDKIIMYNVKYNLDQEKKQTSPVKIRSLTLENHSNQAQTMSRRINYPLKQSHSFTFSQAMQLGVLVEVTAGSPLIGAQKTTVSGSTTSYFYSGETTTKWPPPQDSVNTEATLQGNTKITLTLKGTTFTADIPYTATIVKMYYDGSDARADISGVYKGMAISEVAINYSKAEKIEKQGDSPVRNLGEEVIKNIEQIEDILKDILNGKGKA